MRRYISCMPVDEETPVIPALAESEKEDYQRLWKPGFLLAIIIIALIAIAFTAVFMTLYGYLDKVIWLENDFVLSNRWTIPAGVLIFSLLVGLCQKYLHAPNVIHGSAMESMRKGQAGSDYRTFPGAFLSSICSLLSGASIGPEGTIATMVSQLAIWVRTKMRIVRDSHDAHLGFDMAALASAFNGIVGSPAFTGVLATEFQIGEKNVFKFLIWNLVAGLVGYFFYLSLGFTSFAALLPFPPLESLSAIHREMMVTEQGGGELIWNLYGNAAIRKRMAELIAGARTDIRIIIQPRILSSDIRAALKKCPATVNVEIITSEWDGPVPKTLSLHIRHHPAIAGAPDCVRDMMGGGICIIDSSRVMVIIGSGEDDTVALFSESEGFVSFFIRYYSLLRDWAKKGD